MTKFKSSGFRESVSNAIHGLKLAVSSQRNFVIEVFISISVIIAAIIMRFNAAEFCIIILTCALMLSCELINSVIEFTLDAVYKNNYSRLVEMAKDISAGMVFLTACFSCIIGAVLFGGKILKAVLPYIILH